MSSWQRFRTMASFATTPVGIDREGHPRWSGPWWCERQGLNLRHPPCEGLPLGSIERATPVGVALGGASGKD